MRIHMVGIVSLGACLLGLSVQPSEPVQRWSDAATWHGSVPAAGSDVVIPKGETVLLDVSPPPLGRLQVEGTLIFEDRDMSVQAGSIMVDGKLQIGEEDHPFVHHCTITLTKNGADTSKLLGVTSGDLEIHGAADEVSWLRLCKSSPAGSRSITCENAPDWKPGDDIVVASTDFDPLHAEERTITSVAGSILTLDRPLTYATAARWNLGSTSAPRLGCLREIL